MRISSHHSGQKLLLILTYMLPKVIDHKYYKRTNESGKYFCCFWADLALRAVLYFFASLVKYPTFEDGVFSYFYEQNKYKIMISVHCDVCSKKLMNTKVRYYQFYLFLK